MKNKTSHNPSLPCMWWRAVAGQGCSDKAPRVAPAGPARPPQKRREATAIRKCADRVAAQGKSCGELTCSAKMSFPCTEHLTDAGTSRFTAGVATVRERLLYWRAKTMCEPGSTIKQAISVNHCSARIHTKCSVDTRF